MDLEKIEKAPTASGLSRLLMLLMIVLVCMLVGSLASMLVWNIGNVEIDKVLSGQELTENQRIILRIGLICNHAFTFLISGLLFCYIFMRSHISEHLKLNTRVSFLSLGAWGFVILASYPLIAQLTEWNNALPLPEWLSSSQGDAFALLSQTLKMDGWIELLISILLVGFFAAIGEELIFRGIVQNELFNSWKNHHSAILVSSLIFGGFHLQFERIIPLAFLGAILGYSYHYTKSLSVPIILHFANNTFQVLSIYFITRKGEMPKVDEIPDLPWPFVMASLFFTSILAYAAIKFSRSEE